jgi:urea transporter
VNAVNSLLQTAYNLAGLPSNTPPYIFLSWWNFLSRGASSI